MALALALALLVAASAAPLPLPLPLRTAVLLAALAPPAVAALLASAGTAAPLRG
jgi:hypothetical protein